MISRKTAQLIAHFYHARFVTRHSNHNIYGGLFYTYSFEGDQLYDFLYEKDYEAWFLNLIKGLYPNSERGLKEFIMKLHTGESLVSATIDWEWKQREKFGQRYLKDLAEDIIIKWGKESYFESAIRELIASLELDGYSYRDGKLYYSEANILNEAEEEGILHKLIKDSQMFNQEIMIHHLELSGEHYSAGKWDDSIANSRKFFESIMQEVAAKHYLILSKNNISKEIYDKASEVRKYLHKNNLIEAKELGAISSIYQLLSNAGSHPYIAEKDQARLLRNIALTFSQFILLRFKGFLEKNK